MADDRQAILSIRYYFQNIEQLYERYSWAEGEYPQQVGTDLLHLLQDQGHQDWRPRPRTDFRLFYEGEQIVASSVFHRGGDDSQKL